jgi:glutamine synthetase
LSGATWAPAFIAFGANNRSAMVRMPYGRLEFRLPDAGCNPYLVSAAIIAAGLDGIDRQLEIDHVCNENLYSLSLEEIAARGIKTLPQSLKEACDALEADPLFAEVLGPRSSASSSSSSAWSGWSTAAT